MSSDPSHPGRPGGWVAHSSFCPCAPADRRRRTQSWMTLRPALPLLFVLASACGSSSPSTPAATTCPAHCPTGQVCGSAGTCVPLNSSGGSAPLTCPQADKPVGVSSFPSITPGPGTVLSATSVIFQETHTVGDPVTFTVPSNTASLTIVEQATQAPDVVSVSFASSGRLDTDNVAVPRTVQSPGGTITFNDLDDGSVLPTTPDYYASHSVFFFSDSPATGTLTIPNTSRGLTVANGGTGLPPGSWSMIVSDLAWECQMRVGLGAGDSCLAGAIDSTYQVTVIAKPLDAGGHIPASGKLDVVVYSATASLNAVDTDPDLQRMAATLNAIYAQQNALISIGSVTFKNLPPDVQALYATGVHVDQSGACAELPQLLKNAAKGNTFNVFMVSDLIESTSKPGDPVIVGIDGTIPGPASIGGTVASGAAVSAANLRHNSGAAACGASANYQACGADETAFIIAHEAGHFLGLYHVTEQYGAEFDPLLDTPTCVCKSCSSAPSTCADPAQGTPPASADMVKVNECLGAKPNCGGGDNLMFWLLGAGSQGKLTAEQGQVIRANPLIH
jgi:hypothetical protein